jgi:hypothetical protein
MRLTLAMVRGIRNILISKQCFQFQYLMNLVAIFHVFYLQLLLHKTWTYRPALAFLKVQEGAPDWRRHEAGVCVTRICVFDRILPSKCLTFNF